MPLHVSPFCEAWQILQPFLSPPSHSPFTRKGKYKLPALFLQIIPRIETRNCILQQDEGKQLRDNPKTLGLSFKLQEGQVWLTK